MFYMSQELWTSQFFFTPFLLIRPVLSLHILFHHPLSVQSVLSLWFYKYRRSITLLPVAVINIVVKNNLERKGFIPPDRLTVHY